MSQTTERMTTCCFSGYRPDKLPWGYNEDDERCLRLREKLCDIVSAVYASGIRHFICGMALGCDTLFCETALQLRDDHPDVTLEAALPCEDQAARWNEAQRSRYFKLVEQCDVETLVSRKYTPDCMMRRNMYMVDHASLLIAVYDGRFGGTMQTVGYAGRQGLEIIQIKP
ncbi:Uncharacterized SPBc2 prophage-derived protein YoqJ [Sporobacter termitidis DSM 10068]|uniref:Uncharacterized SPBc2 prophage-derived protein YoqJ n=1 Tax=Sporobacter termitidis DSM 10068 TaxID=1123282 RepID=A0A1M5Z539_9FIRM|nr:SLOG family protein [Sporobacter termitidis]SHI19218.1 Uncharacterized SPBc2 prophage-derived protein YoqJ [Sporobacter termitidis DSM 10068]